MQHYSDLISSILSQTIAIHLVGISTTIFDSGLKQYISTTGFFEPPQLCITVSEEICALLLTRFMDQIKQQTL